MKLFDVRKYGARGLGSGDDTSAIQSAIDASLNYDGGGVVFCPSGIYPVYSTLVIDRSRIQNPAGFSPASVRLLGAGPGPGAGQLDDWDGTDTSLSARSWIGPAAFLKWMPAGGGPLLRAEGCLSTVISRLQFVGTGGSGSPSALVVLRYTGRAGSGGRFSVFVDNTDFADAPVGLRVESIETELPPPPVNCAFERIGFGGDRRMQRGLSTLLPAGSVLRIKFVSATNVRRALDIDGGHLDLDTTNFADCGWLPTLDYAIHLASRGAKGSGGNVHLLNNVRIEGDDPSPLFLSVEDGSKVVCNGFGETQSPTLFSGAWMTAPIRVTASDVTFQQSIFKTSLAFIAEPRPLIELRGTVDAPGIARFRDTSFKMAVAGKFGDTNPKLVHPLAALVIGPPLAGRGSPAPPESYYSFQRCTRTGGRIFANETNWPG